METRISHAHATVMVVDDEAFFRKLLRDILQRAGYTVIAEAADGKAAVDAFSLHRPDITLIDIYMPEKNGMEATKEILSIDRSAKVVICSALGCDEDVEFSLQVGARAVIQKPFIESEVLDTIAQVLSGK
ncbi:MAG: response regulator [Geobacteraceae bacterium]|nr:response regulator [Geobacteraceae bacterium]